jgi:DNA-directed RNA polymerase alpha subunit
MHDISSQENADHRAVACRSVAEHPVARASLSDLADLSGQRLERVVSELVARRAEAIVETISARILQRFFVEVRARERSGPPVILVDSDPIERIPMATRAITALHRIGVRTVGELTRLTEADLRNIRSIGEGSVAQLIRILALYGRRLAG